MAEEQTETRLNGWIVEDVAGAISMIDENPEAGKLTWRSTAVWDGGFGLDVRTQEIEQLGDSMARHFTLRGDHPPELLGQNTGPTAVEVLFAALGACVAGTFAAQATARQVELESLEVDIEGDIDLNGFFGLRPVNPGISNVTLGLRVKANADQETLDDLLEMSRKASPVFDSISRPISVDASVENM